VRCVGLSKQSNRQAGRQEIRNEIFMKQVISSPVTLRSFRRRPLSCVPADSTDIFVNKVQFLGILYGITLK
jgi:hypothetical protein